MPSIGLVGRCRLFSHLNLSITITITFRTWIYKNVLTHCGHGGTGRNPVLRRLLELEKYAAKVFRKLAEVATTNHS